MYRWLEHTSEVELELEAASEQELLADALTALGELLEGERDSHHGAQRRTVHASAHDRPALLAAWLQELLFLADYEGFIPVAIERLSLSDDRLDATVVGRLGEPRPLVKAATYHRLEFESCERGYRGRVVFDV